MNGFSVNACVSILIRCKSTSQPRWPKHILFSCCYFFPYAIIHMIWCVWLDHSVCCWSIGFCCIDGNHSMNVSQRAQHAIYMVFVATKDEMKMIAFNIIIFVRSISLYNYDTLCCCFFFPPYIWIQVYASQARSRDVDAISEFLFSPHLLCRHSFSSKS